MTWLALASVVIGGVWWTLTPSSPRRRAPGAPRAWSRRWWLGRGVYAIGFFFVFFGLSQLQRERGWVAGAGLGVAVMTAAMVMTELVVVMAKRSRRRRASRA